MNKIHYAVILVGSHFPDSGMPGSLRWVDAGPRLTILVANLDNGSQLQEMLLTMDRGARDPLIGAPVFTLEPAGTVKEVI